MTDATLVTEKKKSTVPRHFAFRQLRQFAVETLGRAAPRKKHSKGIGGTALCCHFDNPLCQYLTEVLFVSADIEGMPLGLYCSTHFYDFSIFKSPLSASR
jgi:hypothetical protein